MNWFQQVISRPDVAANAPAGEAELVAAESALGTMPEQLKASCMKAKVNSSNGVSRTATVCSHPVPQVCRIDAEGISSKEASHTPS